MSNEVQLKVRVPEELKDMVDADGRTNKAVVQSALWSEFGGRKKSALEAKKQHKADQLEAIEASIESDQKEKRRVLDEIRSIEAQIERMEDVDERYRQDLDSLLDQLEDGDLNRIVPALCEDVAEDHGKDPSTVFEDCKERALEQERDLLNSQFMSPVEADTLRPSEKKPITEAWGEDDD